MLKNNGAVEFQKSYLAKAELIRDEKRKKDEIERGKNIAAEIILNLKRKDQGIELD